MSRPRLNWIKIYDQMLTSDLMLLKPEYRWCFIGMLLVANQEPERGKIRPHWLATGTKLLSNRIGTSMKLTRNCIATLTELKMIETQPDGLRINNFYKFQGVIENKYEIKNNKKINNEKTPSQEGEGEGRGENKRERENKEKREASPPAHPKFIKPTPQEVTEYANSIGFNLDGEHFCKYYEARGWKFKTGQPVVSWEAAVVTWKKRHEKDIKQQSSIRPTSGRTNEEMQEGKDIW